MCSLNLVLKICIPLWVGIVTLLLFYLIPRYKISRRNNFDFTEIINPLLKGVDVTYSEYIESRIIDQINHYNKHSARNKRWYQFIKIIILVLSTLVTLTPLFYIEDNSPNILTSILGAIITILLGIVQIKQFDRRYIEFRFVCEYLKKETFLFLSKLKENDDASNNDLFKKYVLNVEEKIFSECQNWREIMNSKSDE